MGREESNGADDPVPTPVPVLIPVPVPVDNGVIDWVFFFPKKVEAGSERGGEAGKEVDAEVGVEVGVAGVAGEEEGIVGLGEDCAVEWEGAKKDAADWGDGTGHSALRGKGVELEEERTLSPWLLPLQLRQ